MFIKSAASDTLQGRAIQAINERWSDQEDRWCFKGRETIGIPVCKKKYAPFQFSVERNPDTGESLVTVQRMFGCKCHSELRKAVIEQHGVRKGWEPFGQWSLRKAQEMAKRETERLNQSKAPVASNPKSDEGEEESSSDEDGSKSWTMCHNGNCTWKIRAKYDNIFYEMHGYSESDAEE